LIGTGMDQELRNVLARYLSPITVDAVLKRVYNDEQMNPKTLTARDLERIYQNSLFLSVRMFCVPEKLTDAMIDLAGLLERIPAASD